MPRQALNPPRVRIDLRETPCRTVLSHAGRYQLTLDSTVVESGIELHSTYLGQRQAGYIATNHLAVVAGHPPRVYVAPNDAPEAPVGERRRDCLVHHLDQLSLLIAEATGRPVVIDVTEAALAQIDATATATGAGGAGGALNPG